MTLWILSDNFLGLSNEKPDVNKAESYSKFVRSANCSVGCDSTSVLLLSPAKRDNSRMMAWSGLISSVFRDDKANSELVSLWNYGRVMMSSTVE